MTDQAVKLANLLQEQKALAEQKLAERVMMWIGEYDKMAKAENIDRGIRAVFRVTSLLQKKKYTAENRDQWVVAMMSKDNTTTILNAQLSIIKHQIQSLAEDKYTSEEIDKLIASHDANIRSLSR